MCFFLFLLFLGTLNRFPGSDSMKALPFLGIFMFALRWHQADFVVRLVPGELVFKSGTIFLVKHLDRVSDFNILDKNKIK